MFKAEKIRFGFEKEMNRQLRMIVQTYINKRSVTDKGTFLWCTCYERVSYLYNFKIKTKTSENEFKFCLQKVCLTYMQKKFWLSWKGM